MVWSNLNGTQFDQLCASLGVSGYRIVSMDLDGLGVVVGSQIGSAH